MCGSNLQNIVNETFARCPVYQCKKLQLMCKCIDNYILCWMTYKCLHWYVACKWADSSVYIVSYFKVQIIIHIWPILGVVLDHPTNDQVLPAYSSQEVQALVQKVLSQDPVFSVSASRLVSAKVCYLLQWEWGSVRSNLNHLLANLSANKWYKLLH